MKIEINAGTDKSRLIRNVLSSNTIRCANRRREKNLSKSPKQKKVVEMGVEKIIFQKLPNFYPIFPFLYHMK